MKNGWQETKRFIACVSWLNLIAYCWLIILGRLGHFASAQNITFLIVFLLFAVGASVVAAETQPKPNTK